MSEALLNPPSAVGACEDMLQAARAVRDAAIVAMHGAAPLDHEAYLQKHATYQAASRILVEQEAIYKRRFNR